MTSGRACVGTHRVSLAAALAACLLLGTVTTVVAAPAGPGRARIRLSFGPDARRELFGVSFPDASTGFAAGADGTLVATTDGGATWAPQNVPVKDRADGRREILSAVSFSDTRHGHAVGLDGTILVTADGGATWATQAPPATPVVIAGQQVGWSFRHVSFADAGAGAVVGGAAILTTADGGASWTLHGDPRDGSLMGVSSVDPLHAYAVSRAGQEDGLSFITLSTGDGGRSWQPQAADLGPGVDNVNFDAVAFVDPTHGHAVGTQGRIVATDDGGRTWRLQRNGGVENLTGVAFTDTRRGVAVGTVDLATGGQEAVVFATDDGGLTWVSRLVPDTVRLRGGVAFADRDTAYAVGCRRDNPTPVLGQDFTCADGAGAIVRVAFSPPDAPTSSGSPLLRRPVLAAGAIFVLALLYALASRRRHRPDARP